MGGKKAVVVDVTFRYVRMVPDDWDEQHIEFHLDGSSSCATNILEELVRLQERMDDPDSQDADDGYMCFCPILQAAKFVRDADDDDIRLYHLSQIIAERKWV